MKVKIAWYPWKLRIPQVCANCGARNLPLVDIPADVLKVKRISKTTYQHIKSNITFKKPHSHVNYELSYDVQTETYVFESQSLKVVAEPYGDEA